MGATNPNEARILYTDRDKPLVVRINDLDRGVITSDWNHDDSQFCISGEDGIVRVYNISLPQLDNMMY